MLSIDLSAAINNSADNFTTKLFQLLLKSDHNNFNKLAQVYPVECAMMHLFKNECIYVDNERTIVDYNAIEREARAMIENEPDVMN